MDIFSAFTIAGGLAFFLYGMHVMSAGLEKMAGGKLEKTLRKMTSNVFKALALGAGITIAIQSSSAMTVMLIGLVNSGIMELSQTVGIIMGSNIGTTLTAWILSLSGIESSNIFIKLLSPSAFSPILALVGIIMIMMSKNNRKKDIGEILIGFSILMFGMELMKNAVSPLADMPEFSSMLMMFKNPILGVLIGAVVTAVIQSSAASVGILQALSLTGGITSGMAIPIIMGQNIGTCITAVISSIGASKAAKRVAVVHIYFNVIGTVVMLSGLYGINAMFPLDFLHETITPVGIAAAHSIFNIVATALLLPFSKWLVKMAELSIRDASKGSEKTDFDIVDYRLLNTPSMAIAECDRATVDMAKTVRETIELSISCLYDYDKVSAKTIAEHEDKIDMYEDKLGSYLIKVRGDLSDADRKKLSQLLKAIGDLERMGDHGESILDGAGELHTKSIRFSQNARGELAVIEGAIREIVDLTVNSFALDDPELAARVEPLEQVVDRLKEEILARHIERLQRGECTIELGFILSNLLTNYERISDHCSNIAAGVIKTDNSALAMDIHGYLNEIKSGHETLFEKQYNEYMDRYQLMADSAAAEKV
ncbi:MAG: Na/Pi cotransporter family protein [Oscillospiraceae bacterium]